MRAKYVLFFVALVAAVTADAQQHPNHARGFSPERVYQIGDIDNINMFNGNVTLTLPLGGTYPVDGALSYGLSLVYNSHIWDYRIEGDYPEAIPSRFTNAGLGWQVTMGHLVSPKDPFNKAFDEKPRWVFVSPDGAEHAFFDSLHLEEENTRYAHNLVADGTSIIGYTRDNSYTRLTRTKFRVLSSGFDDHLGKYVYDVEATYEVQQPNGTRYVFTTEYRDSNGTDSTERYVLESGLKYTLRQIVDPFGNRLDVAYENEGGETMAWRLTEHSAATGSRRTHRVNFTLEYFDEDKDGVQRRYLVDSVDVLLPDGSSAPGMPAYRFVYGEFEQISTTCNDMYEGFGSDPDGCMVPMRTWARFLHSVILPDGSTYQFDYTKRKYADNGCGQQVLVCIPWAGALTKINLPTGGSIEYEWGQRRFAAEPETRSKLSPQVIFSAAPAVVKRTLRAGDEAAGEPLQTWLYASLLRNRAPMRVLWDDGTYSTRMVPRELVVLARQPDGVETLNYFSIPLLSDDCYPGALGEWGRPFTRTRTAEWDGFLLSSETYAPSPHDATFPFTKYFGIETDADCGLSQARPLRRTFVRYEADSAENLMLGPENDDRNWRLSATRTEFLDDPAGCTSRGNCHYTQTVHSDFDGLGHYRTSTSTGSPGWSSQTRVVTTRYDVNPAAGRYEAGAGSNPDTYMIGSERPWLLNLYSEQATSERQTYSTLFCFDRTTGFLDGKRIRGDQASTDVVVRYGADGAGNVVRESYFGGDLHPLSSAGCTQPTGSPVYEINHQYQNGSLARSWHTGSKFLSLDLDIDANTGLASGSRDTLGNFTRYRWDALRRLALVDPPQDASTAYIYEKATSGAGSGRASLTIKREGGGDRTERKLLFDGLGRLNEERNLTPGGTTARRIVYDTMNRKIFESAVVAASGVAAAPGTHYSFDVLGRVASVTQSDGSSVSTTYAGSREVTRTKSLLGAAGEEVATTVETYDPFGRLAAVSEQSGGGTTLHETSYSYDAAGRLTSVKQGTQHREFTYDGRGFLLQERHPEKGTTTYTYDARGHVRKIVEDAYPSLTQRVVQMQYDSDERITIVSEDAGGVLKEFQYDHNGTRSLPGMLGTATRRNPFGPGGTWRVVESYDYDAEGRVAKRDTQVIGPDGTQAQSFSQSFTHDGLGNRDSVHYPAGPGVSGASVDRTYTNSLLTQVAGYTRGEITYWPNGMVNRLVHGNGVIDVQRIDQSTLMPRPSELRFEGIRSPTSCEPLILAHPQGATIEEGQSWTLTVVTSGAEKFQWHTELNGVRTPISGATHYSLVVTPSATTTYLVEVGNGCGTIFSGPATVTVVPPGSETGSTPWRRQMNWSSSETDAPATQWLQATTPGNLLVAVLATRNYWSAADVYYAAPPGWELAVRSAFLSQQGAVDTTAIYYMANAGSRSGTETFRLVNADGSVRRSEATSLVLLEYENVDPVSPLDRVATGGGYGGTVSSGTTELTRQANELLITSITAPGTTAVTYSDPTNGFYEILDLPLYVDTSSGTLAGGGTAIHELVASTVGTYGHTATASQEYRYAGAIATFRGSTSTGCVGASILTQPADQPATGGPVTLFVEATGSGTMRYQWYSGFSGDRSAPVSGATAPSLTVDASSTAYYWVEVSNSCGAQNSRTAKITFDCVPPSITQQPAGASINAGQSVTLTSVVSGSTPRQTQWYEGESGDVSRPLYGETSASVTVTPAATTAYWLRVINGCGYANSAAARITVCVAPQITEGPEPQSVPRWSDATLTVSVSGSGPFSYQWYRGDSGDTSQPVSNATTAELVVSRVETTARYWVRITNGCAAANSASAEVRVATRRRRAVRHSDFDGNGSQDLVWRNYTTGENRLWLMHQTTHSGTAALPPQSDTAVEAQGIGDFNGDGAPDLFWRNPVTGANEMWQMSGTTLVSSTATASLAAGWDVGGVADFDGDHKDDLLWRNRATGENVIWLMDGEVRRMSIDLEPVGDTAWNIAASADFDGDIEPDLLWRNYRTGENRLWLMNGATRTASLAVAVSSTTAAATSMPGQLITPRADTSWRIQQAGDFDGDDRTDIVWRHYPSGDNEVWGMASDAYVGTTALEPLPGAEWRLQGSGGGVPRGDVIATTTVAGDHVSGVYGGTVTLVATLRSESGAAVAGRTLTFAINGVAAGSAVTSSDGVATLPNVSLGSLAAGSYPAAIHVAFAGDTSFGASETTASLTIAKAAVTLNWPDPSPIVYGTALGATQLNATASVPGTFVYAPAPGSVLDAGLRQQLGVTFTPADPSYETATASVHLDVLRASPGIVWSAPAQIIYGTPLGAAQLNATADVAGVFAYTPPAGTVLNAGSGQTLRVVFTPSESTNYETAEASVTIDVLKAQPVIAWPAPSPIVYGTPLDSVQLNATTNVDGAFTYTPSAGTILNAGEDQQLRVSFTPADAANYESADATVSIDVAKARPVIAWPSPEGIVYGTPLDSVQLNATATVPGTFAYTPPAGSILDAGNGQELRVAFTPVDAANYENADAVVTIDVAKAKPVLTWTDPASIVYGTALDSAQLNATANVAGTFIYTPPVGTILNAGDGLELRVAFTPADTRNYENAGASVTIDVAKAPQSISWTTPAPIVYGAALGTSELNASVSVVGPAAAGALAYAPASGTVLDAGERVLSVTAAETENYLEASRSVQLTVRKAPLTVAADDQQKLYGAPVPPLTGVLTGVVNADRITAEYVTQATVASSVGTYAISPRLHDPNGRLTNYDVTSTDGTLAVRPAPLVIRAEDQSMQYSDPLPVLTAAFTGFVLGETPAALGGALSLETDATSTSAPGTYAIRVGGALSSNYAITFVEGTLTVRQEDARVFYTGPSIASTTLSGGSLATVLLTATVQDIAAVAESADTAAGDIRNATLTFIDRSTGGPLCTALLGVVRDDDSTTAVGACSFTTDLAGAEELTYTVGAIVGGYYVRDDATDDTTLTITKAGTAGVTGGGHLVIAASAGRRSADADSKMNFGLSAKYHPGGRKIDGNLTAQVRRTEAGVETLYQLTATSYRFVAVDRVAGRAVIQGTARIEQLEEPRAVVADEVPFQLTVTQKSGPRSADTLALTLWDASGGLWFTTRWDGVKPSEQELAGGSVTIQGGK